MTLPRREFLKLAGGIAAAATQLGAAEPHMRFPSQPRQRLAATSWPFRAYIDAPGNPDRDRSKPGMDLTEFPAMVARRFGVANVNPLSRHFGSDSPAYVDKLRTAIETAGSHLVDLGLSGRPFYHPDSAQRRAAVDYGRQWIDIAVRLGSPSVRQHIAGGPEKRANPALAAESLGQMAEYAEKRNIVVNLENDNAVSEDPFFLVQVIEKVNSPFLRALPDFGNTLQGHDDDPEYNYRGLEQMFRHVYNMVHVKDEYQGAGGKTYRVDLPRAFRIASAAAYRGYYSMECDAGEPFAGTSRLVKATLANISNI